MAERRSPVAAVAGLLMSTLLLAAAWLTLGMPNLGLAGDFLSGGYPIVQSAVALAAIICYAVVVASALLAAALAFRSGAEWLARARGWRAVAFILAGAVLLGLSLVSRCSTPQVICCGGGVHQIQEAASLAR